MSDKRSLLEAQIQSLKDIVKTLENTHPDEVAKKWRLKVFEEMRRNKQQQLAHSLELRRLQSHSEELRTKRYQTNVTQLVQDNEALQQRLEVERQLASITKRKKRSCSLSRSICRDKSRRWRRYLPSSIDTSSELSPARLKYGQ